MKTLRCGVIGLGVGKTHIKGYRTHPNAEVVAIADPDLVRLEAVGEEYGVPGRYASAADMLKAENLDVVSVATPNKFHKPLTLAALRAGCHVLCEKPMAMSAAEGRAMIAAAEKAGRRLMINFSYRFLHGGQALKRAVDRGELGEVYFAKSVWHRRRGVPGLGGWFGRKELAGGGPLIDLGVHRIDLALWLMGHPRPEWVLGATYDPIARAQAEREGKPFDVEDMAVALVRFDTGATLEVEASWAANVSEPQFMETRLFGVKGGAVHRNKNGGYEFEAELFVERDGDHYDMKLEREAESGTAMAHFVDCILHGRPHMATGEEGLIVMEVLDAIYKSARQGKPVRVPQKK